MMLTSGLTSKSSGSADNPSRFGISISSTMTSTSCRFSALTAMRPSLTLLMI